MIFAIVVCVLIGYFTGHWTLAVVLGVLVYFFAG